MNITKVNDRKAIIKFSQEDLAKYDLNKYLGTDGWSSRRTVNSNLPFERAAAIEFEKKYQSHNAGIMESATLNTSDNSVDVVLRISKNRVGLTKPELNQPSVNVKTLDSLSAKDKNSAVIKQLDKGSIMKNVIFLNSKTASVTVDSVNFSGTETEVAKLAKHIGQYGNIVSYKVLPGSKVSKVIMMLENDAEDFLAKQSSANISTVEKTAVVAVKTDAEITASLEDFNRYASAAEQELLSYVKEGKCSVKEAELAYAQLLQHFAYQAGIGAEQMEDPNTPITPEEQARYDFLKSLPEELSTKFVNGLKSVSGDPEATDRFVDQFKAENGLSDIGGVDGAGSDVQYVSLKTPEGETLGYLAYTIDENGAFILDDADGNSEFIKPILYAIEENPNITPEDILNVVSNLGEPIELVDEPSKPNMSFDFGYGIGEDGDGDIDDIANVSGLDFDESAIGDDGNIDDEHRTASAKTANTVDPVTGQPVQQPMMDQPGQATTFNPMQPPVQQTMGVDPTTMIDPNQIGQAGDPNSLAQQVNDPQQQPVDPFNAQQVAASVE